MLCQIVNVIVRRKGGSLWELVFEVISVEMAFCENGLWVCGLWRACFFCSGFWVGYFRGTGLLMLASGVLPSELMASGKLASGNMFCSFPVAFSVGNGIPSSPLGDQPNGYSRIHPRPRGSGSDTITLVLGSFCVPMWASCTCLIVWWQKLWISFWKSQNHLMSW